MPGRLLLLLLLVVAFAAPVPAAAMPACHEAGAMPSAGHDGMHGRAADTAPAKATPPHTCVGCVPVADWLGERIAPRLAPTAPAAPLPVTRLDLRRGIAPSLPPPRRA